MTNRVIVKNSTVAGKRPAPRSGKPGELFVNIPDRIIGTYDAAGNAFVLSPAGAAGVVPFDPVKAYVLNDLVTHVGKIYRATKPIAAGAWNAADWEDINLNTPHGVRPFGAAATYAVNDVVTYQGKIYRAVLANSATAWNPAQWEDITNLADAVRAFSATATYAVNDLVAYQGRVYRANAAVPAGAWNPALWDNIGTRDDPIKAFSTSGVYVAGDLVTYGGKIYNAKTASGPAAWDATKWDCITITTGGLAYIGTLDCTKPYATISPTPGVGSFLTNTGTGALHASWTAVTANPPATVGPGDTMVWDGTKFHHNVGQLSALSAATATTLGGVLATPAVAREFVTGIAANGGLTHSKIPAPTAAELGGVKATANPGTATAAAYVNGVTASGDLSYDYPGDAYIFKTQVWMKAQRGFTIAAVSGVSPDFAEANNFYLTGGGAAVTLANPVNANPGQSGTIVLDSCTSLAFGTSFKFEGAKVPTASGQLKMDILVYYVVAPTYIASKLLKDVH